MKKLIENWRDYEKSVLKEEVETEGEEEYGFGDFFNDMMTVSWNETKENPETGEMEEYVNYALNPAFLPVEQQEQLKESIPMQEGIQEVNLRQQYINLLKAAPPDEALQEAEIPRETKSMRDYNLEYLKAKNPENADILDSMTDSDIERAAQKARFADPDFSEPSREETEIYATKNPAFAGPGQMNPFSGRVMSPEDIEARNNIDLGGGVILGDVQKEMALFAAGGPLTSTMRGLLSRAAESGMGRKAAAWLVKMGENLGKDTGGVVNALMSGGKMGVNAFQRLIGKPSAKFTDDLAAWHAKNRAWQGFGKASEVPGPKPIHTPWFASAYRRIKDPVVATAKKVGEFAKDTSKVTPNMDPARGFYHTIAAPAIGVANKVKNNALLTLGLLGLTGAGAGYASSVASKKVASGDKTTGDPDLNVTGDSEKFTTGTVPKSGAEPGIVEPIKKEEPEDLEEEKKKESMTRTEEIVREEVNKFLSNRRKK